MGLNNMNDSLIDRFELWNEFDKRYCEIDKGRSFANEPMPVYDIARLNEIEYGMELVKNAPPVEAVKVVRLAHSRWINEAAGYKNCLACGWEHPTLDRLGYSVADNFCPACGAKMDLKEKDHAE